MKIKFKKKHIILGSISIVCIAVAVFCYSYFGKPKQTISETSCVAGDTIYVFAAPYKDTISQIMEHLFKVHVMCDFNMSRTLKVVMDDKSLMLLRLFSAVHETTLDDPEAEQMMGAGAYLAVKKYDLRKDYFQVKYFNRYKDVYALSCKYKTGRYDCIAPKGTHLLFSCPETEDIAKQKLVEKLGCSYKPEELLQ